MDFVHQQVPLTLLDARTDLLTRPDAAATESAVEAIITRLQSAKSPVFIVDVLVARFQATSVARQLLDYLKIPTFTTPMGKSIVDESKNYFYGVYNGQVSSPGVAQTIEDESDLVIDLGPSLSDSNTGGHSRRIKEDKYISVAADHVRDGKQVFKNVYIVDRECALHDDDLLLNTG